MNCPRLARNYGLGGRQLRTRQSARSLSMSEPQPACAHRECHGSHQCFFSLAFDTCMVLAAQKAAIPMSRMKARSVLIAGSKTSLRLEEAFWVGLQEIADQGLMTLPGLIATIDAQRQHGNRSSALRLFVLEYYRRRVGDAPGASSGISVPNPSPPRASRREGGVQGKFSGPSGGKGISAVFQVHCRLC